MLVTHGSEGIHARPMAIAHLDAEMYAAYLVSDINSVKVDEINANPNSFDRKSLKPLSYYQLRMILRYF
jgi:general stress protein 26